MKTQRNNRARFLSIFLTLFAQAASATIYYVNPANPTAADNGPGTITTPFKTLNASVQRLTWGDTLYIAGGVYREMMDLRYAKQLRTTATTGVARTRIEAMAGAEVIIKGSNVVDGWEPQGNGVFVKRNWTINSQQVFVNGEPLKQIGGIIFNGYGENPNHPLAALHTAQGGIWPGRVAGDADNLVDNSFYYDIAGQALHIKIPEDTLVGRVVEVSTRPFLILGEELKSVTFANLRFRHSNTTAINPSGAISLAGQSLDLTNIQVEYADGAGFDISGNDNIIRNSVADYCGQVGIKARGRNVSIIYSRTNFNNTRGFNKWWEAGGAKFVGLGGLQNSRIIGHQALGNNGDGLWFDSQNRNNKIQDNRLAYNKGIGLHYEISDGAQITKNYIFANKQRGIYIANGSNNIIANNLVAHNGLEAIAIADAHNAFELNKTEWIPTGNYVVGNIIASSGTSLVLPDNNIPENLPGANLYLPPTGLTTFHLGWASTLQAPIYGLPLWQAKTSLDLYSWQQSLPLSDQLTRDLQAMRLYPDFSVELAQAANYAIPTGFLPSNVQSMVGVRPGPK
jgi:parallel beta-helix repeat protein